MSSQGKAGARRRQRVRGLGTLDRTCASRASTAHRSIAGNDHGLTNTVGTRFPDAELYLCEWHLRHALERLMGKLRTEQPEHREAINKLLGDTEAAFTGPSFTGPRSPAPRSPAPRSGRRSQTAATPLASPA
jgi:hypothetical protein